MPEIDDELDSGSDSRGVPDGSGSHGMDEDGEEDDTGGLEPPSSSAYGT